MVSMISKKFNIEVIFDDICWEKAEILDKYAEKLTVDNKIPKYRLYYKVTWGNSGALNILTFVMYNPSYANQYLFDETIQNCIKIAVNEKYDGIQILNIFSIRYPKIKFVEKYTGDKNPNDIDCYLNKIEIKNVVLAWGNKKIAYNDNPKLFNRIKKAEALYILGVKDVNKIKKDYIQKYNPTQIRHPHNLAWTKLGGIDNVELKSIKKEYVKQFNENN